MTSSLSFVLKEATVRPYSLCKQPNGFKREIMALDGIVCTVAGTSGTKSETEANALLLAHAANQIEELVEALRELSDCSPCRNGCAPDDMTCASNKARAALAKATTIDL